MKIESEPNRNVGSELPANGQNKIGISIDVEIGYFQCAMIGQDDTVNRSGM
jgi:hypothetical protein